MMTIVKTKLSYFQDFSLELKAGSYVDSLLKSSIASHTLLGDMGEVLAIAGVVQVYPGVGEAWSFIAPHMKKKPIALCKWGQFFVNSLEELGLHRVQCIAVEEKLGPLSKWLSLIGFTNEGFMPKYTSKQEGAWRFSKVI